MCHAGVQTLFSHLRESYWIMEGRKTIKSVITKKCVRCRRFNSKRLNTPLISLPRNRLKDTATFQVTGIGLFGPLFLRKRVKVWLAFWTCYIIEHWQFYTRFIARRGRPTTVYTDNQTNFTGCQNALESLNWNELKEFYNLKRIEWMLNPPTAAWLRGWWKTLIHIIKQTLFKVLRRPCLSFEELETLLCDCEALLKSRGRPRFGSLNTKDVFSRHSTVDLV